MLFIPLQLPIQLSQSRLELLHLTSSWRGMSCGLIGWFAGEWRMVVERRRMNLLSYVPVDHWAWEQSKVWLFTKKTYQNHVLISSLDLTTSIDTTEGTRPMNHQCVTTGGSDICFILVVELMLLLKCDFMSHSLCHTCDIFYLFLLIVFLPELYIYIFLHKQYFLLW